MKKINQILIVDDHSIVRHGLRLLIEQEDDLRVGAEAESVSEALAAVRKKKPDAAIVDITLKDSNGLELIKQLREAGHPFPILVLSMHDESVYAERALRAGANGYIMKEQADEIIIEALRTVLSGEMYVSRAVSEQMLKHYISGPEADPLEQSVERLTEREREVFECLGQGMSSAKIAEELGLSTRTVEVHRAHIKKKLDADDVTQLVQMAVRWAERPVTSRT